MFLMLIKQYRRSTFNPRPALRNYVSEGKEQKYIYVRSK